MGGRYNVTPKVDESFTCRADSFLRPSSSPNAPWAPQYTMAHKVSPIKADHADNPGPGAFDLEKYTKVERTRYGCPVTIKPRHGAKGPDGPGPAALPDGLGLRAAGRLHAEERARLFVWAAGGGRASWMMVARGPGPTVRNFIAVLIVGVLVAYRTSSVILARP